MAIRDNQSESEAEEAEGEVTVVQQQTRVEQSRDQPSAVKLTEVRNLFDTHKFDFSLVGSKNDSTTCESRVRNVFWRGTAPSV